MKAVVLTDDARLVLDERPVPEIAPDELLVKVNACGICGTDLHSQAMKANFKDDVALGHEFAGTIVDTGTAANGFSAGDEVVVNPIALFCGTCEACRRGFTNQCLTALTQCSGLARDGGMAEFASVNVRAVHRIPSGVSVRDAAWTEPLGVAVRAVAHGQIRPATTVAILGAGAIGQLILQVALAAGAGDTLVVESSDFRREIAGRCGANDLAGPGEVADVGRRYDVVFDCTGAPEALASAASLVAPGGRLVILGSYTGALQIDPRTFSSECSVIFSSVYRDHLEFETAIRLLARGVIDVRPLTTSILPLARHEEAFASLRNPDQTVKIFLDPTLG